MGWSGQRQLALQAPQAELTQAELTYPQDTTALPVSPPRLDVEPRPKELSAGNNNPLSVKEPGDHWLTNIDINSKERKPELNSVDKILAYFHYAHEQQVDYYALRERGLRDYLRENPQLSKDLLNELLGISNDKVRTSLGSMLEILNMRQQPLLELDIMQRIKAGEDASSWLKVLGNWGLQSRSSMSYLYSQLGNFPAAQDQANIVRAISNSSWVKNSALKPKDRSRLQSLIQPHFTAEDASLRSAAFASLRTLPVKDTTATLLAGLRDQAPQVRREALGYIQQRKPNDRALNREMMILAEDSNLSLVERSSLAHLVSQASNPQVDQRSEAHKLLEDITAQIKALPEDERRAMYYWVNQY